MIGLDSAHRARLAVLTIVAVLAGVGCGVSAAADASPGSGSSAATVSAAGTYGAVTPFRVLDTRSGAGVAKGAVPARGVRLVSVLGQNGVPASDVSAVVVNVTALHSTTGGYVTAWASGATRPTATTVSFQPGKAAGGLAIVPVGSDGRISVYNGSDGTVDIVGDLSGYYVSGTPAAAGSFGSVTPSRVMDTRSGTGVAKGAVPARAVRSLSVLGQHGVPPSGVSAVVVNVTALHSTSSGYVTAWASGTNRPTATTVSFQPGKASGELAVVPVGSDGRVSFYNGSNGTVDVVGDLSGYFLAGTPTDVGTFRPVTPARVMDTRTGTGVAKGVPARGVRSVAVLGRSGVPASGVSAVVVNVTALHSAEQGYLTAWADNVTRPTTTTVSFQAGSATGELAVVPVAPDGGISFYNGSDGSVDVVADIAGYVLDPSALDWLAPDLVLPRTGKLVSVSCPSTTFCVAIDTFGNALTYDAVGWSAPVAIDSFGGTTDVSCASRTFCVAIDDTGHALTYDGHTWGSPALVDPASTSVRRLDDVSCTASDFCVAIGSSGLLSSRHGAVGAWTTMHVSTGSTTVQASCASSTFCMVTTGDGAAITFDGSRWSATTTLSLYYPAVSCASAMFCVAVDTSARTSTYDGHRWSTPFTLDAPNDADHPGTGYSPVSCVPGTWTCVTAVNGWAITLVDGKQATRSDVDSGAWDVSCPSTQFCSGVGDADTSTFRGSEWQTQLDIDPRAGGFLAMSCGGATQCATSNLDGQAATFDGRSWTRLGPQDGLPEGLQAVSCPSSNVCIGTSANQRSFGYDGATWSELTATDHDITRLSCVSSSFCVGFGWVESQPYGSNASIFDGHQWTTSTHFQFRPSSVSCVSTTFCMTTTYGDIAIFDGSTWTTQTISQRSLHSVSCVSARFCVAGGDGGLVMTYRDGVWSTPVELNIGPIFGVSCPTETFCVATVGATGSTPSGAIEFDGRRWSQPQTIGNFGPISVSCPTTSFCMVGDTQGQVFAGLRS